MNTIKLSKEATYNLLHPDKEALEKRDAFLKQINEEMEISKNEKGNKVINFKKLDLSDLELKREDNRDCEKRITDIFNNLDEYIGKTNSFDRLNINTIIFLINDFSQVRHSRQELNMDKDLKLLTIEKDLRWLKGVMFERNLEIITR
jgi:hypothetical protein